MRSKPKATDAATPDLTVWALLRPRLPILGLSVLLIGLNRAASLAWPFLSKYLVDDVITQRSRTVLLELVAAGLISTIIQGVSAYLITHTVDLSAQRVLAGLRKRIHQHVFRLPLAYYEANRVGALVTRIMNDVEGVRNILGAGLSSFIGAVATSCFAFVVLVRIDTVMSLAIFSVLIPFGLLLRHRLQKYRPAFSAANAIRSDITGRLAESLGGVRVVKAHRAEEAEHSLFVGGIDRLLQKTLIQIKTAAALDLMVMLVTGLISAVVMYFGGVGMMSGKLTLGDFFRYVMFLGVLISPLVQMVSIGTQFNEAFAGLERVRELLAEPREDQDPKRSVQVGKLKGNVYFEAVSFAYHHAPPVLHEVSFRNKPGSITALVGPSGAGKSTIIGLLAGFYKASAGTVWVDDIDIARANLRSYRANLGIVPQDAFLFSGSIRENVLLGRPGASDKDIGEACRLARVDEFAGRFEKGYNTVVGERGIKLSMGQRQRIAIARALLANPRILILDEATSNLDSISEAAIRDALSVLLRDRTTFVIAHRLSTIRQADQILVIEDGRIIESGSHDTLFDAKGTYWRLYTTQYEMQSNLFLAPGESDHLSRAVDFEDRYSEADAAVNNP